MRARIICFAVAIGVGMGAGTSAWSLQTALASERNSPGPVPPLTPDNAREFRESMAQLSSKDAEERYWAAMRLSRLRAQAEPAIPKLISLLRDLGDKRYVWINPLTKVIVDKSPARAASHALAMIGPASIPALIEAIQTPQPIAQQYAVDALEELHAAAAVPVLCAVLQQNTRIHGPEAKDVDRRDLRTKIILLLGKLGDPRAIAPLSGSLRGDLDPSNRAYAAETLVKLDAHDAVPALQEAVRDPDQRVRTAACAALAKLAGPKVLISELSVNGNAEVAIEFCQHPDKDSLPLLIALLHHRESAVRHAAMSALGRLADPSCVPILVDALRQANAQEQIALCSTLEIFRDARSTPSLVALLGSPNAEVRRVAAYTLGWPGNHEALEPLVRTALRDPDSQVRNSAVHGVSRMNLPQEMTVAFLKTVQADCDAAVRKTAQMYLSTLPAQARATRP